MNDYLFYRPSFFSGLARTLDLFGLYDDYNISQSGEEADAKAIYSDWKAVGADLKEIISKENQNSK